MGVLRPSWFTEILFWIGLLLSEKVLQLKIIIYTYVILLTSRTIHSTVPCTCRIVPRLSYVGQYLYVRVARATLVVAWRVPIVLPRTSLLPLLIFSECKRENKEALQFPWLSGRILLCRWFWIISSRGQP